MGIYVSAQKCALNFVNDVVAVCSAHVRNKNTKICHSLKCLERFLRLEMSCLEWGGG